MLLQRRLADVSAQLEELQKKLAVRQEGGFQVHNAFYAVLANSNRLQWLIAMVVLVGAVFVCSNYLSA